MHSRTAMPAPASSSSNAAQATPLGALEQVSAEPRGHELVEFDRHAHLTLKQLVKAEPSYIEWVLAKAVGSCNTQLKRLARYAKGKGARATIRIDV